MESLLLSPQILGPAAGMEQLTNKYLMIHWVSDQEHLVHKMHDH